MPPSPGDDPSWSVPQRVGDAEVVPVAGVEDGVVHQRREARSVSREKLDKLLERARLHDDVVLERYQDRLVVHVQF